MRRPAIAEDRAARAQRLSSVMERVVSGESAAFSELYDAVAPMVYGTALRVLRDPDLAAEITQEVLLETWKNAARFDPVGGSVMAWVATIAHRRAVDRVRAVDAQRHRDEQAGVRGFDPPRDVVSEEAERRMDRQAVLECMDTLTERQRDAVHQAYFGGLTYREVAEYTSTSLPTIKSRIRDGLRRLRECLEVQR